MGEDENLALEALQKNRNIQGPIIEKYGGTWIKELGDGVLAMFASATDAVSAAAEIHLATAEEPNLVIRIGIHLSEVLYENGDIFGDGVNIASRIEPTAPPRGTHISDAVRKNLSNKKGIKTKLKGNFELRNVKDPVKIYEVVVTDDFQSAMPHRFQDIQVDRPFRQNNSIAVMSFRNLSNDPEQEYFGDGIADEILVTLSNVKNLRVVGRSSAFQFKNSPLSPKEIGKTLQVSYILEGSIRKSQNKVRINAVLLSVSDDRQIWAERYDRELTDIYEVQDDIAAKISKKLKVTFTDVEKRVAPINMEAYEQLLKGRFYVDKYISYFDKALACFTRAIEIDPNYAEAYAELGNLHFLYTMYLLSPPREGFRRAKFYAEKALSLNEELGGAHFLLGQLYFWQDWNFKKAKKQYEKADLAAVPFYFTGIVIDPWYYAFGYGDFDKAAASMLKIIENDPLSFFNQYILSCYYTWGRKPEKAREVLNSMLLAVPNYSEAYRLLAYNSFLEGDSERAVTEARKAVELSRGLGWSQITLSISLAQKGERAESKKLISTLENSSETQAISPLGIAIIYIVLGEIDTAFEYLEKAMAYRDIWMLSLKYAPEFIPIRDDPRFKKLVERIKYPE
jgi:TolB-like protein/Tfp pilus assembly protein PilF